MILNAPPNCRLMTKMVNVARKRLSAAVRLMTLISETRTLADQTVNDDTVGLAEFHDLLWIRPPGQIESSEFRPLKEIEDKAEVSGISCVIQLLHLSHGLFCQCHSLSMDRGATAAALPYGVKLPAAEGANVINKTGVVFF